MDAIKENYIQLLKDAQSESVTVQLLDLERENVKLLERKNNLLKLAYDALEEKFKAANSILIEYSRKYYINF